MVKYDLYTNRKYTITIFIVILFVLIIAKLFYIQIIDESYKMSAENNTLRQKVNYPERGLIYDRNNNLLVANIKAYDIMIIPKQVDKNIDTIAFCKDFNLSQNKFKEKLINAKKNSNYKPFIFIKGLTEEEFAPIYVHLHKYKGFFAQPRYIREYHTKHGGNIFGFISKISSEKLKKNTNYHKEDFIGTDGLEKQYENILKGEKGEKWYEVNVYGQETGSYQERKYDLPAQPGSNIQISIDINLQEYAEKIMSGKRGSIVAIEPNSGEILCLASSPSYDPYLLIPNKKRSENYKILKNNPGLPLWNRSTYAPYPPGSIFKLINALIGLQENEINPNTVFKCEDGWNFKKRLNIGCHEHDSPLNLNQAIAQSCNAYFCSTFQRIMSHKSTPASSLDNWNKHVNSFGLNENFKNDVSNKARAIPNSNYYNKKYGKNKWSSSYIISLGIGQGELIMNPLQMANLAAIIANQGYYKTPHIIKEINGSTKNINPLFYEKKYCTIDSIYFKPIIEGMQTVVEGKHGTAKIAKINNITICGKTGTAENSSGKDHSIFIAFAPKKNPKIAICVYVENGGWGSDLAAPIASLCIEKYINKEIVREQLEKKMIYKNIKY